MTSPAPVWEVIHGYTSYWALSAALDLGLFDALADGEQTAAELAERCGTSSGITLLADVLVSLDLLDTDGITYRLAPASERYLVRSSPASMAALVRLSPGPPAAWPALADTIRRGRATHTVDDDPAAFYPELVAATAPTQRAVAAAVAAHLTDIGSWPEAPIVVDLGAGSGAWTSALLAARPDARAVALDLPEVIGSIDLSDEIAARVKLIAGDYLSAELPVDRADVVVLAHVLRAESPERARALFDRALQLIGPTGTVAIADYPLPDPVDGPDDQRAATVRAARHDLLLGLTMLASTRAGRGITRADLQAWATAGGAEIAATLTPLPRQTVFLIRSLRPEASTS